ncbi:N-acetylglucosamine-6-phosphate deacetylase [Prochlorococcus marinus]|uniref:N-acetylglucosamine-6-phosphate deacetylase n=1 Tax=Prochlorococcus marinus (strain MIT 9211) TaxID=93059 RepID=A9BD28_PROM4|nr:N-acetylglucosamine-6-phosphate deacetylase [Prochlorococcus marinus]ABX08116.1 N-acetylglucosamine-6-phosphate deacetylase [Prochlorococcus marinus str. MIT 9211]
MHWINNIRLPTPFTANADCCWSVLLDSRDIVRSIEPSSSSIDKEENWHGDWLSPMGLDLQINGGLGVSFNALDREDLPNINKLLDRLWMEGVDEICPTIVTCSLSSLRKSLGVLHQARKRVSDKSCRLIGAHLEGPFLSRDYVGAHDSDFLINPTLSSLHERIQEFETEIAIVTLAPELLGSFEVVQKLIDLGVVVSLGHSGADAELSSLAFDHGVSMITHAFNAMPGIHHRSPGPLGEAIANGDISIGLIADGIHVHPKVLKILQKLAPEKIVLVSDALSPYGLAQEKFQWNDRSLIVKNNFCSLEDGTLVGTTLSLLAACKRFAKWTNQNSAAIWSATVAPRIALNKGDTVQDFLVGKSLNQLLRWNLDIESEELTWNHAK